MLHAHKLDIALGLLALLAAIVAACDSPWMSGDESRRAAAAALSTNAADSDRAAEKSLAESKLEARAWLDESHGQHVVWKWSKTAARKAINELYAAGAKEVWVVNISKTEGGVELASEFVIVLPNDRVARQKVFEWIARWEREAEVEETERTKDTGQKYFVLSTDL